MDAGPTTQQFDPVYTHDALPAGARLGGYQIIQVLGRGGFGIVYLALDSSLQRQVAIKEYFPAEFAMRCDDGQVWVKPNADVAAYSHGMKAFLNEAKMLARFDHPSLARVLTFWEENRSAYMVMPYYDGRTLAAVLADMPGPPDEAWLRSLLAPLLSALSTLHNAHCLHLDISPENIIVLRDGRPVMLDFGIASRLATDKTMPLTALLNPAYAPIEQYSESPTLQQGPWSDIYALAGVLHFAIAGVPPARATVRAIDDPQRPLAETVAARAQQFPGLSYSPGFLAAIDKALAVKPRERPRGAAEFQMLMDHVPRPDGAAGMAGMGGMPGAAGATAAASAAQAPAGAAADAPQFSDFMFSAGEPPRGPGPGGQPAPETWLAAEPMDAPPRRTRSRTPVWLASIAVIGLAAAGWTWLQRQPSFANITVADLPPAIVANIPRPASEAMDGPAATPALPQEPTAAGPATGAAPSPAPAPAPHTAQAPAPAPVAPPADARPAPNGSRTASPQAAPQVAARTDPPPTPTNPQSAGQAAPEPTPNEPRPATEAAAPEAAPEEALSTAREQARPTREAPREAPREPARKAPPRSTASALPPEPATPRQACGNRSNFALVYCMQQQCKRWKFNTHPECLEMERRGEL